MTSGERKALAFLAGVGVLGAAARVVLTPDRAPTRDERLALAGQLDAVDSARRSTRARDDAGPAGAPRRRRVHARSDGARPARSGRAPVVAASPTEPALPAPPPGRVDVDVADSAALEPLPGIGPGLAQRIVADRVAHGTYGSLDGLRQVRGVGPKLAARLVPYVTFSGSPRPSRAAVARPP